MMKWRVRNIVCQATCSPCRCEVLNIYSQKLPRKGLQACVILYGEGGDSGPPRSSWPSLMGEDQAKKSMWIVTQAWHLRMSSDLHTHLSIHMHGPAHTHIHTRTANVQITKRDHKNSKGGKNQLDVSEHTNCSHEDFEKWRGMGTKGNNKHTTYVNNYANESR